MRISVTLSAMTTDGDGRDWVRLAHHAIARRAALGDPTITKIVDNAGTWRRLTNHADEDPEKRAKAGRLSAQSLRQIERGLGWGVKAADAVLAGGDPWLAVDQPDLPSEAAGVWVYFKGGEVRAYLPDDPARRARMIEFIRHHGTVVDLGE